MEITYHNQGQYKIPNLKLPEQKKVKLGKYAMLRRTYLMKYQKVSYTILKTTGKLAEHLADIDRAANDRMEVLTAQMAKTEGVTEQLKAADQMKWVGMMNSIRQSAEEIVLSELIYE